MLSVIIPTEGIEQPAVATLAALLAFASGRPFVARAAGATALAIPVFLPWAPGEFRSGLGHGY